MSIISEDSYNKHKDHCKLSRKQNNDDNAANAIWYHIREVDCC